MEDNFRTSQIHEKDLVHYETTILTVVLGVRLTEKILTNLMKIVRKIYQENECNCCHTHLRETLVCREIC